MQTSLSDWNIKDDVLYFRNKIYVPDIDEIKQRILRLNHDHPLCAHPGIMNTYDYVRRSYYWPKMQKYITDYIHGCAICQQMKIQHHGHISLH